MDAAAASGDWRSQLQPEARLRVVNKIVDTLKSQFPVAGPENLDELRKIAVRFEEKTFTAAVSQTDYLKTISMKMLTIELRTQNPDINNQMPSNPANQNPPDPDLMDSASQIGQVVADWQEEVYRKIQSMKELYNAELGELHQKISLKCQQHDALMPQGHHSEQLDNVRKMKAFLDRLLLLFQMTKNSIQPAVKEKLPVLEKQMMHFIASNRRKLTLQRQGQQFPHPTGDTQSMPQSQPSQIPLVHQHDKNGNRVDAQGCVTSMQSTPGSGMQNASMSYSTHVGSQAMQNNIMCSLQSSSNIDSSQDGAQTSSQQGAVGTPDQG